MVRKLDRELEPVSFLGGEGTSLSALDVFVFAGLHDAGFYKLTQVNDFFFFFFPHPLFLKEEYNSVPNIARWYSHVEYLLKGAPGLQSFHLIAEPLAKREKVEAPKKEETKKEGSKSDDCFFASSDCVI